MIVCPLSSKQSDFSPLYVFDHQGNPMIVQSLPQFLDLSLCRWITGTHGIQRNIEGMLMGSTWGVVWLSLRRSICNEICRWKKTSGYAQKSLVNRYQPNRWGIVAIPATGDIYYNPSQDDMICPMSSIQCDFLHSLLSVPEATWQLYTFFPSSQGSRYPIELQTLM